jgi:hypothetical protein
MIAARILLAVLAGYAVLGLAFAAAFVGRGVRTIDPAARDASWGFRAVIYPGAAALWPWLAIRWRSALRERNS